MMPREASLSDSRWEIFQPGYIVPTVNLLSKKFVAPSGKLITILRTTDRQTGASRHHGGSTDGPLKTHDKHDGRVPTGLRGSANSNSI